MFSSAASLKEGDVVTFGDMRWSKDRTRLMPYKGAIATAVIGKSSVAPSKSDDTKRNK